VGDLTVGSLFSGIGGLERPIDFARISIYTGETLLFSPGGVMSNKYTYSVPFTEEELFDCYINQGMSQTEVGVKFGTTQHVVWKAMQRMKLPARKAYKRDQEGTKNSSWKGGRVLMGQSCKANRYCGAGYWYILNPDHPNAMKSGYVGEHIVIATDQRGEPLQEEECVHHKDFIKQNNHQDNLHICTRKHHRELHLQLEHIAVQLYRTGLVDFVDGNYEIGNRLEGVMQNASK